MTNLLFACMLSCFSCVWLFATLRTIVLQAPLFMGFSRQEYWSGLPCPPPGGLPDPEIKSTSLTSIAMAGGFVFFFFFLSLGPPGKNPTYYLPNLKALSHWRRPHEEPSLIEKMRRGSTELPSLCGEGSGECCGWAEVGRKDGERHISYGRREM